MSAGVIDEQALAELRPSIVGLCYRMLACPFAAQDITQEVLVRVWEKRHVFDPARASLRSWVTAVATNACIDELRRRDRRALPVDTTDPASPGAPLGDPDPEAWVLPIPSRLLSPEDAVERSDSIRLAFIAALQQLSPTERAVLVLRDVLEWRASEVADGLGRSTASVESALQRARRKLGEREPAPPLERAQRALVDRYVKAFEAYDVATLTALLHEDATMSMPPFAWWIRGRDQIKIALTSSEGFCRDSRMLYADFNGTTAIAQYLPVGPDGTHVPWALVHVETGNGRITATVSYLNPQRLFAAAQLPSTLSP